jgi:hypothetical protein
MWTRKQTTSKRANEALKRLFAQCNTIPSYPIDPPRAHTIDMNEKAQAMFVESVISPIILLITPMFPFVIPARQRLNERVSASALQ